MVSRQCPHCKKTYYSDTTEGLTEFFHWRSKKKNLLASHCKTCRREINQIRYEHNRDEVLEHNREYYEQNKDKFKGYYLKNKENRKEKSHTWNIENKEKRVEYNKKYYVKTKNI